MIEFLGKRGEIGGVIETETTTEDTDIEMVETTAQIIEHHRGEVITMNVGSGGVRGLGIDMMMIEIVEKGKL